MGKVGRNAPCPCGSGAKWKRCHLVQLEQAAKRKHDAELEKIRQGARRGRPAVAWPLLLAVSAGLP